MPNKQLQAGPDCEQLSLSERFNDAFDKAIDHLEPALPAIALGVLACDAVIMGSHSHALNGVTADMANLLHNLQDNWRLVFRSSP